MAIPIVPPSEELPQRVMLTDAIPAPMPAPEAHARLVAQRAHRAATKAIRAGLTVDDEPAVLTMPQQQYATEYALS